MSKFKPFAKQVHDKLVSISINELFITVDGDKLWEHYLASFPEGTNPIYIKKTEHDCSCCKNFVRNMGNLVAVVNGKIETIWSVKNLAYPFDVVAASMDKLVKEHAITNVFRTKEHKYGAEKTRQMLDGGKVIDWNHFYGEVKNHHFTKDVDAVRGVIRTTAQVFRRGLDELLPAALQTVVDLIEAESLYRGEEHLKAVKGFMALQADYLSLNDNARNNFVWVHATDPATRFRNTAIGTLVQDLSEGVAMEDAVSMFEAKVAPANYKRTTALITPKMVTDAMATLDKAGLKGAINRRFAKLSDVSVNNVLWVDNTVKGKMRDGIEDVLMAAAAPKPTIKAGEKGVDISIDEFMSKILPGVTSMEVLVKNSAMGNFMSLTAPVEEDSGHLFKWNNDFAWSYDGNVTDSIKDRVKRAGGNVTSAKLRISLAWHNTDDLDIHVWAPDGNHIFFGHKQNILDVDMNLGGNLSRTPVENISFTSVQDGCYRVVIDQYNRRETTDIGFQLEVENAGKLNHFSYGKGVSGQVQALEIEVRGGVITHIKPFPGVVGGSVSQDKWGVKSEQFVKVNTLMKSPNYWDDNTVGNKHWFFILDGCNNPEPTRGIYNEYLNSAFEKHRKVLEVLGDKTKCPVTEEQLSGLGFSSTRNDEVLVRVVGKKLRQTYNIKF